MTGKVTPLCFFFYWLPAWYVSGCWNYSYGFSVIKEEKARAMLVGLGDLGFLNRHQDWRLIWAFLHLFLSDNSCSVAQASLLLTTILLIHGLQMKKNPLKTQVSWETVAQYEGVQWLQEEQSLGWGYSTVMWGDTPILWETVRNSNMRTSFGHAFLGKTGKGKWEGSFGGEKAETQVQKAALLSAFLWCLCLLPPTGAALEALSILFTQLMQNNPPPGTESITVSLLQLWKPSFRKLHTLQSWITSKIMPGIRSQALSPTAQASLLQGRLCKLSKSNVIVKSHRGLARLSEATSIGCKNVYTSWQI